MFKNWHFRYQLHYLRESYMYSCIIFIQRIFLRNRTVLRYGYVPLIGVELELLLRNQKHLEQLQSTVTKLHTFMFSKITCSLLYMS